MTFFSANEFSFVFVYFICCFTVNHFSHLLLIVNHYEKNCFICFCFIFLLILYYSNNVNEIKAIAIIHPTMRFLTTANGINSNLSTNCCGRFNYNRNFYNKFNKSNKFKCYQCHGNQPIRLRVYFQPSWWSQFQENCVKTSHY